MHNEVGRRIGRFQILSTLGTGGFAMVYRAEDTELDRQVAIKLLHPQLAADEDFVRRFRAEARAAARLRHPRIVTIYEVGETPDAHPYLVMELLQGVTLSKVIAQRAPFSLEEAGRFLIQLGSALDYLHSQGLIHRDLKPANVMVSERDDVTLMDFGIARALDEQAHLTQTGQLVGTPTYMAPEQIRGEEIGPPVDRYAFGVLAYEILAGRPPFKGSLTSVIQAQLNTPPPPIIEFNSSIPEPAARALNAMLAKDPAARPHSCTAFVSLLLGKASLDSLPTEPHEPRRPVLSHAPTLPADGPTAVFSETVVGPPPAPAPPIPVRPEPAPPARPRISRWLLGGVGGAGVIAVLLLWLFLAGPLAGGNGRLLINSDPPGASVSIDGKSLGVTPLAAQTLAPGSHVVVLDKAGYTEVRRSENIGARQTKTENIPLSSLAIVDQINVLNDPSHQFIATGVGQDSAGMIHYGTKISQTTPGQQFSLVVELAQTNPGQRALPYQYKFTLVDGSGNVLGDSGDKDGMLPQNATPDNPQGIFWSYAFPVNPDGSVRTGIYYVKLEINGKEVASQPIELTR